MNCFPPQRCLLSGIAFVASLTSWSSAQTARSTSSNMDAEELVVLSPFVVNTSRDVGFVATSSLAGGRLAGDLKDTPAAYSVLTSEFIEALQLTDLAAATEWTVNSANLQGDGNSEIFGAGFEASSRGVITGSQQRNFFPLNVNFDAYNLDRIDYSRGPNAILFGNGTFGGNANVVTKTPNHRRSFLTLKTSYGSWDHRRATVDHNLKLTDSVALRTNLLWQDSHEWRDFERDRRRAINVAGSWMITDRTELLLDVEVGEILRRYPPTFLNDNITGWDGVTTFDQLVSGGSIPGSQSSIWNAQGVQRYGSDTSPQYIFVPDMGYTDIRNFANTMRTLAGAQNTGTGVGGRPRPAGTPNINLNNRPMNHTINTPPWMFDAAEANSNFRRPADRFAMSTNADTFQQDYETYSAFLRHRFGDSLYIEAAANVAKEARDTNYLNSRGINNTYIDVMAVTPDGAPNPYFLEPFGDGQRSRSTWGNDYESARIAAAYTLEESRFGSYDFGVMLGANKERQHQRIESMRVLSAADPRLWPFENPVYYRYYWNSPHREMPEITTATARNGTSYPVGWIVDSQRPTDISYADKSFNYLQASVKGRYFNNKLHVLAAVRHDDLSVERTINDNYGDYPANWDGRTVQYRPPAPDDYLSLPEFRPRNSSRQPTDTSGRYQDDYNPVDIHLKETTYSTGVVYHVFPWMSVFGNAASSFNPSTSQLRLDGSIMPSPVAKGWDAGLRFYLLNERMNVALTYYEGSETAQPFEIGFTNSFQAVAFLNRLDDLPLENNNSAGLPVVPRQAFDQRDRENYGYEIEIVANVTPQWRLKAEAARAYAFQTNAWADTRAFIEKYDGVIRQVLTEGGILFNASGRAVLDNTIDLARRSGGTASEANAAVTGFNTIYFNQLPNIVAGRQMMPNLTEWTANFFSDYRFDEGVLKGLSIGAGVRYRGKRVLGYRGADTIQDPAAPSDPTASIDDPSVDAYSVVYSDPYYIGNASISYSFKWREIPVQLHLNIDNLFDDDEVIYSASQLQQRPPGGDYFATAARVATPTLFRYYKPRSFRFTATFRF